MRIENDWSFDTWQSDSLLNLPDLSFVRYCEAEFGINRGIYNAIDDYFFTKGIIMIEQRRDVVLQFLKYLHFSNGIKKNGKIKIGNNGLSNRLVEFLNKKECHHRKIKILENINGI